MGEGVWVMLLGGEYDGKVYRVPNDMDVLVTPRATNIWGEDGPDSPSVPWTDRYYRQRFVTPDGWVQTMFILQGVDIDGISNSDVVRAIMEPWRAQHRGDQRTLARFEQT
jgi:hypothetical protein